MLAYAEFGTAHGEQLWDSRIETNAVRRMLWTANVARLFLLRFPVRLGLHEGEHATQKIQISSFTLKLLPLS